MKTVALALGLLAACSTKYSPAPPSGGDDVDDDVSPDAGTAPTPDSPPAIVPYPEGPYGTATGATIQNLFWQGFADSDADADDDPFNEPAKEISLEDFFSERNPGSKILVLTNSASWCGACQEEASEMPAFVAEWMPKGVRFMTGMIENSSGGPASLNTAKSWGQNFDLTTPVVADPEVILDPYYTSNGIPFNLFIDTRTMKIIGKMSGYDSSEAEAIINAHLD